MIRMTMEEENVGKRNASGGEHVGQATIEMTTEEDTKQGVTRSEEGEGAVERRDTEENKEEEECTLELGEQVDHFEVLQGIRFNLLLDLNTSPPFCYNFSLSWFRNGARQVFCVGAEIFLSRRKTSGQKNLHQDGQ